MSDRQGARSSGQRGRGEAPSGLEGGRALWKGAGVVMESLERPAFTAEQFRGSEVRDGPSSGGPVARPASGGRPRSLCHGPSASPAAVFHISRTLVRTGAARMVQRHPLVSGPPTSSPHGRGRIQRAPH